MGISYILTTPTPIVKRKNFQKIRKNQEKIIKITKKGNCQIRKVFPKKEIFSENQKKSEKNKQKFPFLETLSKKGNSQEVKQFLYLENNSHAQKEIPTVRK
jgi:hypothetical protein